VNISGLWLGSFSYPAGLGPTTPFLARIEEWSGRRVPRTRLRSAGHCAPDHGGSLAGSIIEPNTVGASSTELEAVLSGSRDGHSVDFTKVYDGASDAAHAVDYAGRLSGDGNSITGVWSLADLDGTFEMHREAVWEEQEGVEAEVVRLE
jgi:hypothetical protein